MNGTTSFEAKQEEPGCAAHGVVARRQHGRFRARGQQLGKGPWKLPEPWAPRTRPPLLGKPEAGFPQATTGSIFFAGNRNSVTHVPGRLTLLPMFPVAPTDAVCSYAAPSRLTSIIVMSSDCRAVPRKRTTVAMIASSAPTGSDRPGPAMAASCRSTPNCSPVLFSASGCRQCRATAASRAKIDRCFRERHAVDHPEHGRSGVERLRSVPAVQIRRIVPALT